MSALFHQILLQLFINRLAPQPDTEIGGGEIGPLDDDQRRAVQGEFRSPPRQIGQGVAIPWLDVPVGGIEFVEAALQPRTFAGVRLRARTGAAPLSKSGPLIDTR